MARPAAQPFPAVSLHPAPPPASFPSWQHRIQAAASSPSRQHRIQAAVAFPLVPNPATPPPPSRRHHGHPRSTASPSTTAAILCRPRHWTPPRSPARAVSPAASACPRLRSPHLLDSGIAARALHRFSSCARATTTCSFPHHGATNFRCWPCPPYSCPSSFLHGRWSSMGILREIGAHRPPQLGGKPDRDFFSSFHVSDPSPSS
jgi:hypothetical protein